MLSRISEVNKKNPFSLEICEVPTIEKFQNVHAEIVKSNYEHLKDLEFSDVTDKDTLEIHMFIGADSFSQFQRGEIQRGNENELVAIETTLGWQNRERAGTFRLCANYISY